MEKISTISWAKRQTPSSDEKPENDFGVEENQGKKTAKQRANQLSKSINVYFRDYCANSSLHGVRYLGERGRNITEKIWWLIVFIASILICAQLIVKTWDKWDTSPVIVSFAQSPTPIWQIPFPAVTICSETKARQSIYNFTEAFHKFKNGSGKYMSDEELKQYEDVSLLCDTHILVNGTNVTDNSAIEFIHKVAPPYDEMIWLCKYGLKTSCRQLFHPMLTEEGLCYTFNMMDSPELLYPEAQDENYLNHGNKSDWDLYEGYRPGAGMKVYPFRAFGAGFQAGLSIMLRAFDYDLDYICRGPVQGFKVLLHNPAETPRVSQQYFRAPLNQEVLAAVQPNMMTTSEGLRSYHPSRRHCFFQNEKKLRFYKIYTQQNCEIECLANFTLSTCGCVKYYMPQTNNTPICGSGRTRCATIAQTTMLLREVETEISNKKQNQKQLENCKCLPSCTSLSYSIETSQADFNTPKMFAAYKRNESEFSGMVFTKVNIFFKNTEFISSVRSELFGSTDFISSCGGLLGIFMGFSFLSLVEIIYYLTLRMSCNIKMHGRKMWNASRIIRSKSEEQKDLKRKSV